MNLQCPKCKTTFEVDESHYAALLEQVRNAEFEAELKRRVSEMAESRKAEAKVRELELTKAADKALADKEREIERLKALVDNNDALKKAELADARSAKDREIAELKSKLALADNQRKLDIANERSAQSERINKLNQTVTELGAQLKAQEIAAKNRELELREQNAVILKAKDEEIRHYKDLKSRLSTKMLGETLEQHCLNAFNQARSYGQFASAYFEKDNDISGGTKGDFIFRDYIDGQLCLSIMFEMKNEDERTQSKHRNEDFFAKLDKDRREKDCEYAVLVSTLEADNEFYNGGIVDVSYRYEKMFVVRPQFFLPIISLLSRASRRSAETIIALRSELAVAKAQSIDVSTFEERRDKFVADFAKYVEAHQSKHEEALASIDKAIAAAEKQVDALRKVKSVFDASQQKLLKAQELAETKFTIRSLTRGNPTMKQKFDDARK